MSASFGLPPIGSGTSILAVYRDAGISGSNGRTSPLSSMPCKRTQEAPVRRAVPAQAEGDGPEVALSDLVVDGRHCGCPFIDTKLEGRIRQALAPGFTRSPSSSALAAARSSGSRLRHGLR